MCRGLGWNKFVQFFFTYNEPMGLVIFINLFVQYSQSDLPPFISLTHCLEAPGRDSNLRWADPVAPLNLGEWKTGVSKVMCECVKGGKKSLCSGVQYIVIGYCFLFLGVQSFVLTFRMFFYIL